MTTLKLFTPVDGTSFAESDCANLTQAYAVCLAASAALFARDVERTAAIGEQIEAITGFISLCDYPDPAMCWMDCKDKGRGRAMSVVGFHNLTLPKSFHLRT